MTTDLDGYEYSYDYRNRIREIDEVAQFQYDALGRRFYKKDLTTNTETYYFFDADSRVIAQYVKPENEDLSFDRSFVYGNEQSEVLAMFLYEKDYSQSDVDLLEGFFETWLASSGDGRYDDSYDSVDDNKIDLKDWANFVNWAWNLPEPNETRFYFLHDALGSVRGMVGGRYKRTDDREFYNYDAYGTPSELSQVGNPYLFHGQFAITTSPLVLSRFYRDYLPNLGRWMQFDPSGYVDSMNLYEFVYSNPSNFIDPWGLWTYSGMYKAYFEKYGDTGKTLFNYAFQDGYIPMKTNAALWTATGEINRYPTTWLNWEIAPDYWDLPDGRLAIPSSWWGGLSDSDSMAAGQLYAALKAKYGGQISHGFQCMSNIICGTFTIQQSSVPGLGEILGGGLEEEKYLPLLKAARLGAHLQGLIEDDAIWWATGVAMGLCAGKVEPLPVVKTKKGVA